MFSMCRLVERSHCELSIHSGHFAKHFHCSVLHRMIDGGRMGTRGGAAAEAEAVRRASKASHRRSSAAGKAADHRSRRGDREA